MLIVTFGQSVTNVTIMKGAIVDEIGGWTVTQNSTQFTLHCPNFEIKLIPSVPGCGFSRISIRIIEKLSTIMTQ